MYIPFSGRWPYLSALLLLPVLAAPGCRSGQPTPPKLAPAVSINTAPTRPDAPVTVGFYNLENLFDTQDDPKTDDKDFLPGARLQWSDERYHIKLERLASVIAEIGGAAGLDVLGVAEVENRQVLEDLVKEPAIAGRHYSIVHFDSPDPRGIDVALLYKPERFTPTAQRSVPIALPDTTMGTRDILVVDGQLNGTPLTLMVGHWPSRRSGRKSVNRRYAAARQARRVIDEQLKADPQARIVLMGDLNDAPTDTAVVQLLNSSPDLKNLPKGKLYNAYYDLQVAGKGTMYYRSRPDVFDMMLLSPGLAQGPGLRFRPGSAAIYSPERLTNPQPKFPGEPLGTYIGRKYLGGCSDHFPVYLTLVP